MLPLPTVMSSLKKLVTGALKVKVKVTAAFATPALSSVMVRVGARVSNGWLTCAGAVTWLPAASVTPVVLTSSVRVPSSLAAGATTSV